MPNKPTSFRIDKQLLRLFRIACAEREVQQQDVIEAAISWWVKYGDNDLSDFSPDNKKVPIVVPTGKSGSTVGLGSTEREADGPGSPPKKTRKLKKEIEKIERGINGTLPDEKEADPPIRASGGKNPGGSK